MSSDSPRASLDLTHVLYEANSHVSLGMALISLTPILLMPAYAVLAVQTREVLIIAMWAGQLACEGLNWVLKHIFKEERPLESIGDGYGFPSSHSQWMGYFASFLMMHLFFRHRFVSSGFWILDQLFRCLVYIFLALWAGLVCYSRFHLTYHSTPQVMWGASIGVLFGIATYLVVELMPTKYPESSLGQLKGAFLDSRIAHWLRLRDGWALWEDGGREEEWQRWKVEWERRQGRRWKERNVSFAGRAKDRKSL